jgi:NADP-dependent 3-hydroxy acid dehydrogenase YdfG
VKSILAHLVFTNYENPKRNGTGLVTGANRGIGYAFVNALLQAGAEKVYATARDIDSLKAVAALDANRVIPLQLDVTDQDLMNTLRY